MIFLIVQFDGEKGDNLTQAAAKFCQCQSIALANLRAKQKSDHKLSRFLEAAESNPLCRRLQLKDIIPTGMQRLTKYHLLLENVAKYTGRDSEEYKKLQRTITRSREVLNYVNRAKELTENYQRLLEIQRRLDKSAFDKVDHPIAAEYKVRDKDKVSEFSETEQISM